MESIPVNCVISLGYTRKQVLLLSEACVVRARYACAVPDPNADIQEL